MGFFGKKKEVRNLTKEEEAEIKEEMARQMLSKNENDIGMVKKIKDLTNMSTGQAKELFLKFRDELTERQRIGNQPTTVFQMRGRFASLTAYAVEKDTVFQSVSIIKFVYAVALLLQSRFFSSTGEHNDVERVKKGLQQYDYSVEEQI